MTSSIAGDPFGERTPTDYGVKVNVLGCKISVKSTDQALLDLAIDSFESLPHYRLNQRSPGLSVSLILTSQTRTWSRDAEPPQPAFSSGSDILCATVDAGNFAVVDPSMSRALICISAAMLQHPYHARYELIEFAMLTLASRVQSLVPLHAACVGSTNSGLLLMGPSGSGKSTLGLHALAGAMQFLSEDSAFVSSSSLKVAGVPNYLYLQRETFKFLEAGQLRRQIQTSPMIRRRSGVKKYQVNLREIPGNIARAPLQLAATVMLSRRKVTVQPALKELSRKLFVSRLRREQPYAMSNSNWMEFEDSIAKLPAYELRRTVHPDIAVRELQGLLG
jgi:energy-coupling factor transporter ATP-binding protein EcfA2